MTEATLKSALTRKLRELLPPAAVVHRHEDRFNAGYPDLDVSLNRRTTWIEVKFANPRVRSRGVQDLEMLRLARAAYHAVYVIYDNSDDIPRTLIVTPEQYKGDLKSLNGAPGFNHKYVVEYIRKIHDCE